MNLPTPFRGARALLFLTLPSLAATVHAAVLVNLDATGLPLGPLATWNNTGTVAGNFAASGAPAVTSVSGVKAVTLAGNPDFFTGPIAPASVTGVNPNRSIEVWAYNPAVADEETLIAWGHRGGPDGTNLAFNYGSNGAYGAVGHWGGADIGWFNAGGSPAAGTWHHLVYTYDGGGTAGAGTTRVYADGVLMNSEFLGTLDTFADTPFVVGGQGDNSGVPVGFNSGLSIGRIRVHDTVLSDAQISAQYDAERPTFYPTAYLTSSGFLSASVLKFTTQDLPGLSEVDPATFTVTANNAGPSTFSYVTSPARVWQVEGGEGIITGGIESPEITIPAVGPIQLSLVHRYNFEPDLWDAGVVEVSINGGPFTILDAANFSEEGYAEGAIIGNGFLKGLQGWNAQSNGFDSDTFITSVATIPGVTTGDKVRLRFVGAWDDGYTPDGIDWEIAGVSLSAGASNFYNEDFSAGDGGYIPVTSFGPLTMGALSSSKTGGVTTFQLPVTYFPGSTLTFTLSGKDLAGNDLSFLASAVAPRLNLAPALEWPASVPGPQGSSGTWGVRTYLNEGIDFSEDLVSVLSFLANASDRTPDLTPDTVIDTQEPSLNFLDPESNSPAGVIGCPRPFPGNALSTATNGGTTRADDHVVTSAHGSILITEESEYTFNLRGDDGMMFRIRAAGGADPEFIGVGGAGLVDTGARNIVYVPAGTGDQNTRAIVHLTPGVYNLEYVTWEGGGGFWYQVSAAKGFFVTDAETNTWALVGFQTDRTAPVTYPAMVGDWTVLSSPPDALLQSDIAGANAAVDAAVAADATAATSHWSQINFFDPQNGATGAIAGDVPWPRNADPILDIDGNVIDNGDDDKYAMRMTGTMHITEAGEYLIGFQGDDGTRLTVGGVNAGFSALTENATGSGVIGRADTIAVNSGSLGAAANFSTETSALFEQPGALAGSTDKAISMTAADGQKMKVSYNADLNPAGDFSAEIWVKPSEIPGGLTCIYSSGNFGDPRSGWLIYMDPFNGWDFRGYLNAGLGTAWSVVGGEAPVADQWYHIVATWQSATGTATLYVNGESVGTPATGVTGYVPTSDPAAVHGRLHIGSRADNAFGWAGAADEAAVYPTALSPEVVQSHYQNGISAARTTPYETLVQASAPLGYWRLNETVKPRADLGTITTDVPTGNSRTVGRIFLNPGDYPITATYWEDGGGSYVEIFAGAEIPGGCVPIQLLRKDGYASVPSSSGLELVSPPPPVPPSIVGGLTRNPDGALSLTFASVPNASYTLESSTDLSTWLELNDNIVATGSTTTVTGTAGVYFYYDPAAPRKYYRIRAN